MDAIKLLEKDHEEAKKAMEKIAAMAADEKKKKAFLGLKKELETHDRIEEEIFYPSVKADFAQPDKAAHEVVEEALAELAELPVEDAAWDESFQSMRESLLRHVKDEETKVFPKIRQAVGAQELKDLGRRMQQAKEHKLDKAA